ncbi:T9SS type A sorting domain-containing protein [Dyadobacter sp. CY107]|uniref:T9SS type A sorting domain-containing protein n=1 Tax=Dyadobacter fanqingshengii TaxID=2906443 RepID=UPI001F27244E|nr:T9SS type A sorting domain-containing protein [Dyadobacter fanqingshengii]MCF2503093.1 T9SS type A sorting domain-containing protein [Dyadobacter fanqingshengii]
MKNFTLLIFSLLLTLGLAGNAYATDDCGCKDSENALKDGNFESLDAWKKSEGTTFKTDDAYNMCGKKNGLIDQSGYVYQDVQIAGGSAITMTVYGGTHNKDKTHKFYLLFYNSNGDEIESARVTVDMNYQVTGNGKLEKYALNKDAAPADAVKVRFAFYASGGYFKVDVACMSVTPPTCETCNNNQLVNESFENGTNNWATTGHVFTDAIFPVCGSKSLILAGNGSFSQDFAFESSLGNSVTLSIWAAVKENRDQKIEVIFLDGSNKVLGTLTQQIDKLVNAEPVGMQKYIIAGAIPPNTTVIRIKGSGTQDYLAVDAGCLTFSGPPLPVTLSAFDVKKEGTVATITWSTTVETNSDHFEVEHSGDGKKWTVLDIVAAQGESKELVPYTYTHTNPLTTNLYRLRMVDQDGTFAFSTIKSLNFDGDAQMKIYPNPSTDHIVLSSSEAISNVKFYDQRGVLVLNTIPDAMNAIDVRKLHQGTYLIKVNDGSLTRRIVIVR